MKKYFFTWILLLLFLFPSCNYLDVVPYNDVERIETIFEKREEVQRWLMTCYDIFYPDLVLVGLNPSFSGTDELVGGDYIRRQYNCPPGLKVGDGLQMAQEPSGNIWSSISYYAAIRYCNIFLENIGRTYNMKEEEKLIWVGEIKALKAHLYFELMRRYGPIILVPKNISTESAIEDMQQPRSPIDDCVQAIVELLDDAIESLPPFQQKERTRWLFHSKESASMLKAMTLLYAASPLFNGNQMMDNFKNKNGVPLFPAYDKEKWKLAAEATDEAIRLCEEGGFSLISGTIDKPTKMLNTMRDIEKSVWAVGYENKEAIFMLRDRGVDYNWTAYIMPLFPSTATDFFGDKSKCSLAPSIKAVEMYYTEHGLPISEDKHWMTDLYTLSKETDNNYQYVVPLNVDVLNLHRRREPRFYANIASDRTYWYRKRYKYGQSIDEAMLIEPYQGEIMGSQSRFISSDSPQNLTGYWMKKFTNSEVPLRQYATGMQSLGEQGSVVFRLAELYLMSAEAWNEYLETPSEKVYNPLNKVRRRAGILDVQDAWDSYSKNPQKVKTQAGMRGIIHQEWNIEFMFEGHRFYNLRRWMKAAEELNEPLYGWNIVGQNAQQFYNNFEGPKIVWSKRNFIVPRDYFYPIRSEEVLITNCVQNPGW